MVKTNRVYRHFKGNFYIVSDIARHSETGEEMVVYRSLKDGKLWTRPLSMFDGYKETEHGIVKRFSLTDRFSNPDATI